MHGKYRVPQYRKRVLKMKMGTEKRKTPSFATSSLRALVGQSRGTWICHTEAARVGMELKWLVVVPFSHCRAEGDPVHSGGQIKKG